MASAASTSGQASARLPTSCERIVERLHEHAAHGVDHQRTRTVLGVNQRSTAARGVAGKFNGRIRRGARSMNTSASF